MPPPLPLVYPDGEAVAPGQLTLIESPSLEARPAETNPVETKPDLSQGLTGGELGLRLGYKDGSKVSRQAKQPDFPEWTKAKDKDGIAWVKNGPKYFPLRTNGDRP